jgi:hypothetical protein
LPQKVPDENAKVTLDESALQRLLSAAFVIQEHNDSLQSSVPDPSEFKAADLAEIAEAQNLIRAKQLDLISAAALIAQRAQKLSRASGVAVALAAGQELSYISCSGVTAPATGSTVPFDQSLGTECIRTGRPVALPHLKNDARLQAKFFLGRGVKSFAAVPFRRAQQLAGVLEMYFAVTGVVDPATLRACELLAGLLNGLVDAQAKAAISKVPAFPENQPVVSSVTPSAPSTPVPANQLSNLPANPIDELKARLDRDIEREAELERNAARAAHLSPYAAKEPSLSQTSPSSAPPYVVRCTNCGCPLEDQEAFCGLCGTARPAPQKVSSPVSPISSQATAAPIDSATNLPKIDHPGIDLPKKDEKLPPELQEILARFPEEPPVAPSLPVQSLSAQSLPPQSVPVQSAPLHSSATVPASGSVTDKPSLQPLTLKNPRGQIKPSLSEVKAEASALPAKAKLTQPKPVEPKSVEPVPIESKPSVSVTTPAPSQAVAPQQWKSASETRAWLESVKPSQSDRQWLKQHRANLYLAVAVTLLVLVLFGVGAPSRDKHQLNWFDSALVNLGLAQAPADPVFLGNPQAKVWVDLHTALYYCQDSTSYGKTRGGKFETQREAQEDQFQPASRQSCP